MQLIQVSSKHTGYFILMPNTMPDKWSPNVQATTFYLHWLRTLMDELSWGWKLYLPTAVCFLVPYCAGLAPLLKSFACMHVGYEIPNVWESVSSWSQFVPMQSISIYPHHTHIVDFPLSPPCTVVLNERVSVSVGAIVLYFYSGDPQLLRKIRCIAWKDT